MFTAKNEILSLCDQHQIFLWYRSSWQKGTVQDHIDLENRGLGAYKIHVYANSTYTSSRNYIASDIQQSQRQLFITIHIKSTVIEKEKLDNIPHANGPPRNVMAGIFHHMS